MSSNVRHVYEDELLSPRQECRTCSAVTCGMWCPGRQGCVAVHWGGIDTV